MDFNFWSCTHVPYIRILCPWDWNLFFVVWFFFVLMDLNSSPTCTLVPHIRVLCSWEWISTSRGLVFEFLVLHAHFGVFFMMSMHEAIKWQRNSINLFCVTCVIFVGRSCKLCILIVWYT
jgi:hypothetical protein